MRRAITILAMAASFMVAFTMIVRANHFVCKRFANADIQFYNGATGEYYTAFQNEAINDPDSWHNATVINLQQVGGFGQNDQINAVNANYGASGWAGLAEPGDCGVPYMTAHANQYYLDNHGYFDKAFVACHELGHTVGLDHRGSGESTTCLREGGTGIFYPPYPDQHDLDEVNSHYSTPPICTSCPRVGLQAANGQWVQAVDGGGGAVMAAGGGPGGWETFRLIDLGGGNVALQASSGHYVVAEGGGGREVLANRTGIGGWETFQRVDLGGGYIALRASNGQYVVAEGGGGQVVNANRNDVGPWETFYLAYLP